MPIFKVLTRVDAFVDYIAEVDAASAEDAVELTHREDRIGKRVGVTEFDARRVVALDHQGKEIESTARGDF